MAVITGGVFSGTLENGAEPWITHANTEQGTILGYNNPSGRYDYMATASSISTFGNTIRNRISNISFNNTVELNSTVYFCRVNHNEFNYSSNPTYLSSSGQLRVKNASSDTPVAYITTVGLYSSDNELLAVAKLSEPLKKDPNTELTIRVRLDY